MVGAALSSISTILATLAAIDQLPMCSFWSSSPSLSDKDAYPLFARSYPSDDATTKALPVVLKEFGWSTIGVLHADDAYANAYAQGLRQSLDITVALTASFENGKSETFGAALDQITTARTNIIVAIVFDADMVRFALSTHADRNTHISFVAPTPHPASHTPVLMSLRTNGRSPAAYIPLV